MEQNKSKSVQFIEAIKKYWDNNSYTAWDIFWEFRCSTDIFDEANSRESATQLFCYLCCFGMARATTKLAYSNLDAFEKFYLETIPVFKEISKFQFESLSIVNRKEFINSYESLGKNLKRFNISKSDTMRTKLLMAVTGHTPALDRYFNLGYKKYFGKGSTKTYTILLTLREEYHHVWKDEIEKLPEKYKFTRRGNKNQIPPARLIDMGFWSLG